MGKSGKKQQHRQYQQKSSRHFPRQEEDDGDDYPLEVSPSSSSSLSNINEEVEAEREEELAEEGQQEQNYQDISTVHNTDIPSKFLLYQQSVQSPKGDISYLQKFFLMYVGGRKPLHLQEDFCGTALLSTEWLRSDPCRTAIGLDLDLEALNWCMENNFDKIGTDNYSRISLFHGNVLQPHEARLVKLSPSDLMQKVKIEGSEDGIQDVPTEPSLTMAASSKDETLKEFPQHSRDIVCAFNYSCCCLHVRKQLVLYFKHVLNALSRQGGIFVMDLYGGKSSEHELQLERRFPDFTYIWEQARFDIVQRRTTISLHYHLHKPKRKLRYAFSYSWRLWSLPEIRDCLEEAGFNSIHFWIRAMPDTEELKSTVGFGASQDVKYKEVSSFKQQDAWNAYVVAVAG
ncbi:hypothetical protein Ancab_011248 [Ancistrocladus abbreviatus]